MEGKESRGQENRHARNLEMIAKTDPEAAARLTRLLDRVQTLRQGNAYGERLTERQLDLVIEPLFQAAEERAKLLELITVRRYTVSEAAEVSGLKKHVVFSHLKELVRRNLVEIEKLAGEDPLFIRKNEEMVNDDV